MQVIGINGKPGVGKTAVADYLVERHGFAAVYFGAPIREELLSIFPRTLDAIHAAEGHEHEMTTCAWAARAECVRDMIFNRKPPIVRALLQEYALMRRNERDEYWAEQWTRNVSALMRSPNPPAGIVAPDVRYTSDVRALLDAGGKLWRLERPGCNDARFHESQLDGWKSWDATIQNSGTLPEVYDEVDRLSYGIAHQP